MLAPSELLKLELAYLLSKDGHRDQWRKELDAAGNPVRYFEHPRRVALIVMDECGIYDPDFIIAALGHDLLEDSHMSPQLLEFCFGTTAAKWIKMLSKVPKDGYYDRFKKYGTWEPMLIKLCDRLDNTRSLGECKPEFIQKQCLDTMQNIYPLAGKLLMKAPVEKKTICESVAHKIRELTDELVQKHKTKS